MRPIEEIEASAIRFAIEMEKEKRGYLLTNEVSFAEAYKRAVTDFYTYNGYLTILVANDPSQVGDGASVRVFRFRSSR